MTIALLILFIFLCIASIFAAVCFNCVIRHQMQVIINSSHHYQHDYENNSVDNNSVDNENNPARGDMTVPQINHIPITIGQQIDIEPREGIIINAD